MDAYHIVCSDCDAVLKEETDEHSCNYWFHEGKHYGNSILIENYCVNCVKKYTLYDGRVESLCKRCQRYANAFIFYPKFLEICIFLFREADGSNIRDVIDDEKVEIVFDRLDKGDVSLDDLKALDDTHIFE